MPACTVGTWWGVVEICGPLTLVRDRVGRWVVVLVPERWRADPRTTRLPSPGSRGRPACPSGVYSPIPCGHSHPAQALRAGHRAPAPAQRSPHVTQEKRTRHHPKSARSAAARPQRSPIPKATGRAAGGTAPHWAAAQRLPGAGLSVSAPDVLLSVMPPDKPTRAGGPCRIPHIIKSLEQGRPALSVDTASAKLVPLRLRRTEESSVEGLLRPEPNRRQTPQPSPHRPRPPPLRHSLRHAQGWHLLRTPATLSRLPKTIETPVAAATGSIRCGWS